MTIRDLIQYLEGSIEDGDISEDAQIMFNRGCEQGCSDWNQEFSEDRIVTELGSNRIIFNVENY